MLTQLHPAAGSGLPTGASAKGHPNVSPKLEPGLSIESLDASKAIYRLIKYAFHEADAEREEEEECDATVHVLDLKTLLLDVQIRPVRDSAFCRS